MNRRRLSLYLSLFAAVGMYGLFSSKALPLFGSLLAVMLLLLAGLWNYRALSLIEVKRGLSADRVRIGEEVYFQLEICNRKILPLLWLNISLEISRGLSFYRKEYLQEIRGQRSIFQDLFSLKWYERVKRSYLIIPGQRGVYTFGPGRITAGGLFGIFTRTEELPDQEELVVYPRILPLSSLGIRLNYPFGPRGKEGWLYPDPLNRVGVRPYQPTDGLKRINWKATARHLQLESDINQPSLEPELHLFLSTRTSEKAWEGFDRDLLETAVSWAASLVDYGCRLGFRVGLYTDGMGKTGRAYRSVRPGRNPGQRARLLTALARLDPYSFRDFTGVLARERKGIRTGSTVVVISPIINDCLRKYLYSFQRQYRLILITCTVQGGKKAGQSGKTGGFETYYLDREGSGDGFKWVHRAE